MLKLERIKKDERLLRALTGLNHKALEELKPAFAEVLSEAAVPRRSEAPREREPGGGRKPRVSARINKLGLIAKIKPFLSIVEAC